MEINFMKIIIYNIILTWKAKAMIYMEPPEALKGYQVFRGSLGTGSVKVSLVSLLVIIRTDSPKNVRVTQPVIEIEN